MLTDSQSAILRILQSAVEAEATRRVVYCSDWLGWLPYGCYTGLKYGQEVAGMPSDWQRTDLNALEEHGLIRMVDQVKDVEDEFHERITYEVAT